MSEIKNLSKQIDFNNLTYYLKNKSISPMNFIDFKAPLHLHKNMHNVDTSIAKA